MKIVDERIIHTSIRKFITILIDILPELKHKILYITFEQLVSTPEVDPYAYLILIPFLSPHYRLNLVLNSAELTLQVHVLKKEYSVAFKAKRFNLFDKYHSLVDIERLVITKDFPLKMELTSLLNTVFDYDLKDIVFSGLRGIPERYDWFDKITIIKVPKYDILLDRLSWFPNLRGAFVYIRITHPLAEDAPELSNLGKLVQEVPELVVCMTLESLVVFNDSLIIFFKENCSRVKFTSWDYHCRIDSTFMEIYDQCLSTSFRFTGRPDDFDFSILPLMISTSKLYLDFKSMLRDVEFKSSSITHLKIVSWEWPVVRCDFSKMINLKLLIILAPEIDSVTISSVSKCVELITRKQAVMN